jgi:hypothetical protein
MLSLTVPQRGAPRWHFGLAENVYFFSDFFPRVWLSSVSIIDRMQTDGFRELVRRAQASDPEAIDRLFREVSPSPDWLTVALRYWTNAFQHTIMQFLDTQACAGRSPDGG